MRRAPAFVNIAAQPGTARAGRAGARMHRVGAAVAARLVARREAALRTLLRPATGMSPGSRRLFAGEYATFQQRLQACACTLFQPRSSPLPLRPCLAQSCLM